MIIVDILVILVDNRRGGGGGVVVVFFCSEVPIRYLFNLSQFLNKSSMIEPYLPSPIQLSILIVGSIESRGVSGVALFMKYIVVCPFLDKR